MLQRLGIAAAVAGNPKVLFLDEPCSSLDPLGRRDVLEFIDTLRGTTTVFMSTHILADVERVCDTVGIIQSGRLVASGRTEELTRRYAPPVLEIELETADAAERLARALSSKLPGATLRREGGLIRISSEDLGRSRSIALSVLAASEAPLLRMESSAASLEDVFIRLVGGET
jgi:ABC-2 type transport system ATP-binding protein